GLGDPGAQFGHLVLASGGALQILADQGAEAGFELLGLTFGLFQAGLVVEDLGLVLAPGLFGRDDLGSNLRHESVLSQFLHAVVPALQCVGEGLGISQAAFQALPLGVQKPSLELILLFLQLGLLLGRGGLGLVLHLQNQQELPVVLNAP